MHPLAPLQLYSLRRSQWRSQSELRRMQWKRLRSLIRHCYERVPYYRRLFDSAGIKPEDVRGLSDLGHIPATSREALQQAAPQDLFADGKRPASSIERRTSGTTGRPLSIVLTPREREAQDLVQARALMENGLRLRDRRAVFVAPWQIPDRDHWFQRLGVWRKAHFSIFDDIRQQMPDLERLSPDSLAGTPAVLKLIALETAKTGGRRIAPRTVFSTADILDSGTRQLLESAFDVRVTDIYGSLEFGCIAWQCPEGDGYHVNSDSVVLELLDGGEPVSPGETGEVVCTSLLSYGMPFLHYRLGDMCTVAEEPCTCGRGLPLIDAVQGRSNDAMRLPHGQVVTPQAVADTMVTLDRMIEQFTVVQESEERVSVQLVRGPEFGEQTVPLAEKGLRELLGDGVQLEFSTVDHIDRDGSGKQRAIVSRVSGE